MFYKARKPEIITCTMVAMLVAYALYFIGCCCEPPKITLNTSSGGGIDIGKIRNAHATLTQVTHAAAGIPMIPGLTIDPYGVKYEVRPNVAPGTEGGGDGGGDC